MRRDRIGYFLILILFFSCQNNQKETNTKTKNHSIQKKQIEIDKNAFDLKFKKYINSCLILKNELIVYDKSLKKLKTIKLDFASIFNIDSISISKIDLNNTKDDCELLNLVHINSENFKGWVLDKDIYEIQKDEQLKSDTVLNFDKTQIKLLPTKNFNIGVYNYEIEGISGCQNNHRPLLIFNTIFNKMEYIPIINHKKYDLIDYMTYDAHDGWYDKLFHSQLIKNTLHLIILREYQEGASIFHYEIVLNSNQSKAKIIKKTDFKPQVYDTLDLKKLNVNNL
jgi:hypothetical protein